MDLLIHAAGQQDDAMEIFEHSSLLICFLPGVFPEDHLGVVLLGRAGRRPAVFNGLL
jgi:hypothetical protein